METMTIKNWDILFTFQPFEAEEDEYPGCEAAVEVQQVFNGKRNITNLVNIEELESKVLNYLN